MKLVIAIILLIAVATVGAAESSSSIRAGDGGATTKTATIDDKNDNRKLFHLSRLRPSADTSDEDVPDVPESNGYGPGCPDPQEGVSCIRLYAPVICFGGSDIDGDGNIDGCIYPNSCVAGAAMFSVEDQCTDYDD